VPDALLQGLSGLSQGLDSMAELLLKMEAGVGLLLAVGLSMSAAHFFSLLANRLGPVQIAVHLFFDALGLSLAFLMGIFCDSLILTSLKAVPLHPISFANHMLPAIWPGLFYILVGAPYISDLIAVTLFAWIHLNTVVLLKALYGIPLQQGLVMALPGFALALVLIALLFAQRWKSSYAQLAREVALNH